MVIHLQRKESDKLDATHNMKTPSIFKVLQAIFGIVT